MKLPLNMRGKRIFWILLLLVASVTLVPIAVSQVAPTAIFTYSPLHPLADEIVTFDATASSDIDGTIDWYYWDFGDTTTENVTDPIINHTYTNVGVYTVNLTVTDDDGLTHSTLKIVKVGGPIAVFTYSPETPTANQTITFDASASSDLDGNIEEYYWDFNDSTTETTTDLVITHVYNASGTYTVSLTVTDNDGLTGSIAKSVTVASTWIRVDPQRTVAAVGESFVINVTVAEVTGLYGWEFKLYYNTTILNATDVVEGPFLKTGGTTFYGVKEINDGYNATHGRVWAFCSLLLAPAGVDGSGTLATVNFTVTGLGSSVLSLLDTKLSDRPGSPIAHHRGDGYFSNMVPTAYFTWAPEHPLVDETATFNATLSAAGGGQIVSYSWDFGDGNVTEVTVPIITHAYTAYGAYAVNLAVTNEFGLTDTESKTITVRSLPVASFTYSPSEPFVNGTVTFDASASSDLDGTIVDYAWDFGDGNVTSVTDPVITHVYTAIGTYTLNLTVTDNDGLTDSITQSISIGKLTSTISISVSPETITIGETITINGSITPTRAEVTVTIRYRVSGETTWNTIENVTTDENSQYSYTWTPEDVGTYEVQALWGGDVDTLLDESDIKTVDVQAVQTPIILYALAGIAVVIVVAAIAIYFLRIRKKP